MFSKTFFAVMLSVLLGTVAHVAQADSYPDRPVTLLVGYSAGGGADLVARTIARELSIRWSQAVTVINQPGAGGMIAASAVVRAKPDGYTLLLGYTPEVSIAKLIYRKMSYDPLVDLTPVGLVANAPLMLVAGPKAQARNYEDILHSGRTDLTFASPGAGTQQHLAGELLSIDTKIPMTHVPYRGGSAAMADLLGGQVDLFFATPPLLLPQIAAGKVSPIFIASANRLPNLPEVPTAAEIGLDDFEIDNWFGVYGPRGMGKDVVNKLSADIRATLASELVQEKLGAEGFNTKYKAGQEFHDFVQSEMKKYQMIIERAHIEKQ